MSSNPVANGGYDGPLSPIAPEDDVTFALSPRATFEKERGGVPHVRKKVAALAALGDGCSNSIPLYTHLHWVNLSAIDTHASTWSATYSLTLMWNLASLPKWRDMQKELSDDEDSELFAAKAEAYLGEYLAGMDRSDSDWMPPWWPSFTVDKCVDRNNEVTSAYVFYTGDDSEFHTAADWIGALDDGSFDPEDLWCVMEKKSNIKICEDMELQDFPLDQQDCLLCIHCDLPVQFAHYRSMHELPLEPRLQMGTRGAGCVSVDLHNMDTADFHCDRTSPYKYKLHNTYNLQRHDCAAIELAIFVDRHMAHLFWNVIFMSSMTTLVTCAVWALPPSELGTRLELDFTLMIVGQAFKLVIGDKLPPVNYLTLLDIFIIGSFMFTIFGIVFHCIPLTFIEEDGQRRVDLLLCGVWTVAYVMFNCVFWQKAYAAKKSRNSELVEEAEADDFEVKIIEKGSLESQWMSVPGASRGTVMQQRRLHHNLNQQLSRASMMD